MLQVMAGRTFAAVRTASGKVGSDKFHLEPSVLSYISCAVHEMELLYSNTFFDQYSLEHCIFLWLGTI